MGNITNIFGGEEQLPEVEHIDGNVAQLTRKAFRPRAVKPGTPDVLLAREAIARVERADGWDRCAEHRLAGAYDDDEETKVVLSALAILRERGMLVEPGDAA